MGSETVPSPGPAFGREFTEHMVVARHHAGRGWTEPEVVPFADLPLSPAAMVLHYGQSIFEGLKAFRQPDGAIAIFRPGDHARRFNRSAERLAMPRLPSDLFVDACSALVAIDHASVPAAPAEGLYLRPMMLATEVGLGVRAADEYLFAVIASPAGAYFGGEPRPLRLWASTDYVRAAPGGTGFAKCGGNYGASLAAKQQAVAEGCDETLWLDALEHKWIEEMGGMNIVFVEDHGGSAVLVTPPVHDTILDGVTRRSILELAPRLDLGVVERPVSLDELTAGAFREAFACGTAAVIVPIGSVRSGSIEARVGDGAAGPMTMGIREALIAIQEGHAPDPFGWRHPVVPAAQRAELVVSRAR